MNANKSTIAVLGTGRMGSAIARDLLAAGFHVVAWNRTAARAQHLADDGAELADSPALAAKEAQIVLTMLRDGDAVFEAMTDRPVSWPRCGRARPGSRWGRLAWRSPNAMRSP